MPWYVCACLLTLLLLPSHHSVKALQSVLLLAIHLASPLDDLNVGWSLHQQCQGPHLAALIAFASRAFSWSGVSAMPFSTVRIWHTCSGCH